MDQEAPSGTNGEDTPDKPKCDRDVPDVHELPSYSKVEEEEFHYELIKKPMIGAGGDVGQMKDKIKDDEKSSNLVSKVDEEEIHYEVMKKPMIGAGGDVG